MVGVAQLVRVPGCGPGGRGFKSPHSPHTRNEESRQRRDSFFVSKFALQDTEEEGK